jgi:regulator of sigma E protease
MGSAFGSLVAFIVAISVLVAVHEYGHYIVGRWTGMTVLRFSIGFGKPIWTRVAGADRTEYCVSAIPLGGYVRFLDTREGPIPEADEGRAFNQRPVPQRIAVLLAGPAFNFLFAIVAYWALFLYGIPTLVPAVGEVESGSYAAQAGLEQAELALKRATLRAPYDGTIAKVNVSASEMAPVGQLVAHTPHPKQRSRSS